MRFHFLPWVVTLALPAIIHQPLATGEPHPSPAVFIEAEEFRITSGDWTVQEWGTNYYAASFANSFLSRQRYLGAPEQGHHSEAAAEITIPAAADYLVCIRYEAAYGFETQFRLRIEQGGKTVLDRGYGALKNPKLWAFRQKITPQVRWPWGPVENIVWEGTDVIASLAAGPARLVLSAGQQPIPGARRNVDLVMLTTDVRDVQRRIEMEQYLPLDGLLTQAGDLYLKIKNPADAKTPVILLSPVVREHSPYWVHLRNWGPLWIDKAGSHTARPAAPAWIQPGEESPWVEVGSQMDALNVCGYFPEAECLDTRAQGIDLEFQFAGRGADGQPRPFKAIRYRDATTRVAAFSVAGNVRYTQKVETHEEILDSLLAQIRKFPARGRIPEHILFYNTFVTGTGASRLDALKLDIALALGNNVVNNMPGSVHPDLIGSRSLRFRQTSAFDVRGVATEKLPEWVHELKKKDQWKYVKVISLGDEIGLEKPKASHAMDAAFRDYLEGEGLTPADLLPNDPDLQKYSEYVLWSKIKWRAEGRESNPRVYYYNRRFEGQFGLRRLRERTETLERLLPPGVLIGANYSPHPLYSPHFSQWFEVFRNRAMTMPWSEDYLWQIPITSQQILGYLVSAMRCSARKHDLPIYMYVMPHTPGNTPASFRRAFYADVAHGAKSFDFFSPIPTAISYTENNMLAESTEMYRAIYDVIRDAGAFEDIVFSGKVRPAEVAILISDATEIWNPTPLFNTERQHLYLALKHDQFPVDFLTEAEVMEGGLEGRRAVYFVGTHMRRDATAKLVDWVDHGGILFAAGAVPLRDEANQPSADLQKLFGLSKGSFEITTTVLHGKDQLPRLTPIDAISYRFVGKTEPGLLKVYAAKGKYRPLEASLLNPTPAARSFGAFSDAAPALFVRETGKGKAVACGALPGMAYAKTALPDRPCDRGSTDDAYTHFLPVNFDQEAKNLITRWAFDAAAKRPVITNDNLVETSWIENANGLAVPLINYRGQPIPQLEVRVQSPGTIRHVSSVTHGPLEYEVDRDALFVRLPLDVADMLLLRRYPPEK